MKIPLDLPVLVLTFQLLLTQTGCHFEEDPKLLLVSLDGFRWNYLNRKGKFPNFKAIINQGVKSEHGVKNAFLTKTLPNHYTIVTGLYEESHGIVANEFYDPDLKETFSLDNLTQQHQSKWFDNGGEPIWVTNQKSSTSRRSGSLMWPGSYAAVKGFLPYRYYAPYDRTVPFRTRIDKIVSWFADEYPINLGLLYFEEPDYSGHKYGPDNENITKKIEELDADIGYLLKKLEENDILDGLNIIITSDHGMTSTPTDEDHKVDLDVYLSLDTYTAENLNPVITIRPKSGFEGAILNNLSSVPHLHVYKKEQIPSDYHYTNNSRIDPILAEPDEHYWGSQNNSKGVPGEHGYNNSLPSMHPFFIAMGPSFKTGATVNFFNMVDIYPLMCHILHLTPAPNNGSLYVVKNLLKEHKATVDTFWAYVIILIFSGLISGVFCVAACRVHRQYRKRRIHFRTLTEKETSFRYSDLNNGDKVRLVDNTSDDEFDVP